MAKKQGKNTEVFTISMPRNSSLILNEIAKSMSLSRSKLIELTLKGNITLTKDDWKKWELYYKIIQEKEEEK